MLGHKFHYLLRYMYTVIKVNAHTLISYYISNLTLLLLTNYVTSKY
jgi:hypothetical protein